MPGSPGYGLVDFSTRTEPSLIPSFGKIVFGREWAGIFFLLSLENGQIRVRVFMNAIAFEHRCIHTKRGGSEIEKGQPFQTALFDDEVVYFPSGLVDFYWPDIEKLSRSIALQITARHSLDIIDDHRDVDPSLRDHTVQRDIDQRNL